MNYIIRFNKRLEKTQRMGNVSFNIMEKVFSFLKKYGQLTILFGVFLHVALRNRSPVLYIMRSNRKRATDCKQITTVPF